LRTEKGPERVLPNHCASHTYANCHGDSNCNADGHSYGYIHAYVDAYDPAKAKPDTETTPDSRTETIGFGATVQRSCSVFMRFDHVASRIIQPKQKRTRKVAIP
jgi:hypothetical protein